MSQRSDTGTIYLSDGENFDDVVLEGIGKRVVLVDNSENNEKRLQAEKELGEVVEKNEKIEKLKALMDSKESVPIVETEQKQEEKIEVVSNEQLDELPDIGERIDNSKVDSLLEDIKNRILSDEEIPDLDKFSSDNLNSRVEVTGDRKKAKKVDLSQLSVVRQNLLENERDLKTALYGNKAAFEVAFTQSGYIAKFISLVSKDFYNIINSTLSRYEYRETIYKMMYQKIIDMNCGRMSFDDFLKMTSIEDAESGYYGLYCSTFQNAGNLNVECPHCHEDSSYLINNNSLVTTKDPSEVQERIREIRTNVKDSESLRNYSMVNSKESYQLPDSGIIIELKTASLYDSLEILRIFSEELIDREGANITNSLYINKVLVPTREGNTFTEESDKKQILRIIENLSIDDSLELQDLITERLESNRITYSMKGLKCPKCGKELPDVPVDLENLLFTVIYGKMQ